MWVPCYLSLRNVMPKQETYSFASGTQPYEEVFTYVKCKQYNGTLKAGLPKHKGKFLASAVWSLQ